MTKETIEEIKRQAELAAKGWGNADYVQIEAGRLALISANELLQQQQWQPIEKDYIDAEVYLCYFPENKGVERYKAHGLLSVAKTKGATHYMIPQPPTIALPEGAYRYQKGAS